MKPSKQDLLAVYRNMPISEFANIALAKSMTEDFTSEAMEAIEEIKVERATELDEFEESVETEFKEIEEIFLAEIEKYQKRWQEMNNNYQKYINITPENYWQTWRKARIIRKYEKSKNIFIAPRDEKETEIYFSEFFIEMQQHLSKVLDTDFYGSIERVRSLIQLVDELNKEILYEINKS